MDTSLFLEQFGHLAESPGGVSKLRSLILELAVRGKLVEQNPDDEPASDLLKRIEVEKKLSPIGVDEIFYDVPDNWAWGRLGEICEIISGSTPKSDVAEYWDGNIVWITPTDLGRLKNKYINGSGRLITSEGYTSCSATLMPAGSVVMSSRAPIGHLGIANVELCTNQGCKSFIPLDGVSSNYLYYALKAFVGQLKTLGSGTTFTEVSKTKLIPFLIPLPPLAEQQRIVARVDELMQLCDQLEAEQVERNHLREQATKSTLFHLTSAPSKAEARRYWGYAEQHFSELFDRVSTVQELRATILQLAVQGRLVPQNPYDEPAGELLKRIEAEQQRLVKAGELKPSKPLPPIREDEMPYELPSGWEWVRIDTITNHIQTGPFGSNLHKDEYVIGGIPIVNPSNMINGRIVPDEDKTLDQETFDRLSAYALEEDDLIMARRGELGRCAIVTDREVGWLCGTGSLILKTSSYIYKPFLWLFFQTELTQAYLMGHSVGSTMDNLNQKILLKTPFPLAPENQMKRIVTRVDELMQLCYQLEAEAEDRRALSGRLFDSVVHYLFEELSS